MSLDERTITPRRYFMLAGWAHWLASRESSARSTQEEIKRRRAEDGHGGRHGNYGILVRDDYWALQYQRLEFYRKRARRACMPHGIFCRVTTVNAEGCHRETIEESAERERQSFHHCYRRRAHEAVSKLKAQGRPLDVREELDCINDLEALAELARGASGYA